MHCLSDMDMQAIHAEMQCPPRTPLHALAGWEPDRLARVSRWQVKSCPGGKEVIRNYARVVMALAELHSSARSISSLPMSAVPAAHKPSRNSKASLLHAPPAGPLALVAGVPGAAGVKPPTETRGPQAGRWLLAGPTSLSSELASTLGSWSSTTRVVLQWALLALAWLPLVVLVVFLATLATDPLLLIKLLFEGLRSIPMLLRAAISSSLVSDDFATLHAGHIRKLSHNFVEAPPLLAHPVYEPSHAEAGAMTPFQTIVATLAAESGGAGVLWLLISKGFVAAPAPTTP